MKFRINKFSFKIVFVGVLLVVSLLVFVKMGDIDQLIYIEFDQQLLDMQGNVVIFIGNVVVIQGMIKINVDKVVVICLGNEKGKEVIEGFGNLVIFYQMQDNGKLVKGWVLKMCYELQNDYVVLMGNVYLEQFDSNIKGDKIIYLVKE